MNEDQRHLRARRREHDIPQRELGLTVKLSQCQICSYELGTPPSPARMRQLLRAIDELAKVKRYRSELRVQSTET